jgi:hypothetical protein
MVRGQQNIYLHQILDMSPLTMLTNEIFDFFVLEENFGPKTAAYFPYSKTRRPRKIEKRPFQKFAKGQKEKLFSFVFC